MTAPRLDGIHHVKLPVRDLARSRAWYESRLGYRAAIEFTEQGVLTGVVMRHPNGGPDFGLRLDPAPYDHGVIPNPKDRVENALHAAVCDGLSRAFPTGTPASCTPRSPHNARTSGSTCIAGWRTTEAEPEHISGRSGRDGERAACS